MFLHTYTKYLQCYYTNCIANLSLIHLNVNDNFYINNTNYYFWKGKINFEVYFAWHSLHLEEI